MASSGKRGRGTDEVARARRILVAEDDPAIQRLIEHALVAKGYEVEVVDDGLEALLAMEKRSYDLVLVDIMMPRLDGMNLVKALKDNEDTEEIPVIFITAKSDPRTMLEGLNIGARSFINKPFTIAGLLSKVKQALSDG